MREWSRKYTMSASDGLSHGEANHGETEGYIQKTRVKAHRSLLAQLRGRTAPLQNENSRYACLPVEQRTCKICNSAIMEHFCVGCPGLKEKEKVHTAHITP